MVRPLISENAFAGDAASDSAKTCGQVSNILGQLVPLLGQPVRLQDGSVTVVVELGPQTLTRLDRLLAVLERGQVATPGLPPPLTFTTDDGQRPKATSPYLDASEAAEYLGINVKSLYGLVERRQLVPLRGPRRSYRFTKEMLDEYLRSRR